MEQKLEKKEVQLTSEQRLESINQSIIALREKAEQAEKERELYIKGKIVDLETLTQQGDKIATMQKKAEEALASFEPLKAKLDNDPEFVKQLAQAQELVAQLKKQAQEVFEEISKIGQQPEITSRIEEEDEIAGKKAEADKKLQEELDKDIKQLTDGVVAYSVRSNTWYKDADRLYAMAKEAKSKLALCVAEALDMFDTRKNNEARHIAEMMSLINQASDQADLNKLENLLKDLPAEKELLGFWGNKKIKKAIDFLLSKKEEFDNLKKAVLEANSHQQNINDPSWAQDKSALAEKWKRIMEKSGGRSTVYLNVKELIREAYQQIPKPRDEVRHGDDPYQIFAEISGQY